MTLTPIQRANTYHLIMDIGWFGFATATTSRFLSVYAIRLGGTPMQVAWLTALPAIVLLITSIFGGWWRSRYADTTKALTLPALGFRFSFLMLAFTPYFPVDFQAIWLIIAVTLPAIPQGVAGVVFLVMMREAVDTATVTRVVGWRTIALNIGVATGAVLCGLWLEHTPFPQNYQMMFLVAFIATLVSWWHCLHVRPQVHFPTQKMTALWSVWRSPRLWDAALTVGIAYIAFFALLPLVPFFLIKERGMTEGFIAAFGLMELGGGALSAGFAGRFINLYGDRRVASIGMALTAIPTLLIALVSHSVVILIAAFMLGATWTMVTVTLFSVFTKAGPDEQATEYATVYNQTIGLATFIGPLLGSALAESGVTLTLLLIGGAILRIITSWLIATPINISSFQIFRPRQQ